MVSDSEKRRVMGFDSANLSIQESKMSNNQKQNDSGNDVMLKDILAIPDPIKL